jgi:hypothetical protein
LVLAVSTTISPLTTFFDAIEDKVNEQELFFDEHNNEN